MKVVFRTFIILFLMGIVGLWQLKIAIYDDGPLSETKSIVVGKGANSFSVGKDLQDSGIIKSAVLFRIASKFYGIDKTLKAGEYEFSPKESLFEIMQQIGNGEVIYRKITLAEGLTTKQMLDIINNDEMLSGNISIAVAEGEMLPETYSFVRGDSKDSIILRAKAAMAKAVDDAWNSRKVNLPLKNKKELLILASIVEKETGLPEERGLVASVFVNRLKKGMKLQTDPTVIYAITQGKSDLGRLLTRKDLNYDNPYNTYVYYGLPPAPICSPGKAALSATANPEVSDYIYFVASGNGGHNFSSSLKQHNDHVADYRKKLKNK